MLETFILVTNHNVEGGGDDANKKKGETIAMETELQQRKKPERRIYQKTYYDEKASVQE